MKLNNFFNNCTGAFLCKADLVKQAVHETAALDHQHLVQVLGLVLECLDHLDAIQYLEVDELSRSLNRSLGITKKYLDEWEDES